MKESLKQRGLVISVLDEIVYCIGLPVVKFGEVVFLVFGSTKIDGLVVNIT